MAHDVFISYSGKNKASADGVCATLEANGIRCWIAPRDVVPGMEWGECVLEGIEQARIFVLVFSAEADASPQIRREVERAVTHGLVILPLRVEDVLPGKALEYFIGNVHWLDALTPPMETHFKNLSGTIKMLLARLDPRVSEAPQPQSVVSRTSGEFRNTPPLQFPHGALATRSEHQIKDALETSGALALGPQSALEPDIPETTPVEMPQTRPAEDSASRNKAVRHSRALQPLANGNWIVPVAASVAIVVLVAAVWYLRRPAPTLHISKFSRITLDGRSKGLGGTDGSRLYLTLNSPNSIAEIGISGGGTVRFPIDLPGTLNWLLDISPDGSHALVGSSDAGNPVNYLWNVRILGGSIKRIGIADNASFSPDGGSVIFTNQEGDIYTVRSDGTEAHRLATVGPTASHIHWSPDGAVIRFDRAGKLWEMNSDGTGLHQVFMNWRVPGSQCCGHWISGGDFYVFLLIGSPSAGIQMWARDERRGIFRPSPTEPFQLTFGPTRWGGPIPGKDGRTIYAPGRTLRGELSRFDSKSKEFQTFLGGISAEFVSFSNDGKSVAYVSYPDGILYKANRDGSNPVQLSEEPLYPISPSWSPDSKQILFSSKSSDGRSAIYIVPYDGGSPQELLPQDNEDQADPSWSPDGMKVVFAGGDSGDEKKEGLRILNLTSGQVSAISGSTGLRSPGLSPDGRYIAALASDKPNLRVYDLKSQRWSTLPVNVYAAFHTFSRDSRFIYFLHTGRDQGVFRIRVAGGGAERVVDMSNWHLTGLYSFSMSLDPTDAPLVLRDTGSDDIYALTLER